MVPGVGGVFQVVGGGTVRERRGQLVAGGGWSGVGRRVPEGRGRRRVARHGVAVVRTVLQGHLSVLVELFELGAAVLEPDFHLDRIRKEQVVSLSGVPKGTPQGAQPGEGKSSTQPLRETRQKPQDLPSPASIFLSGRSEKNRGLERSTEVRP